MTADDALRGFARAFCDALAARMPARLAPLMSDDVDWTMFGPIDLFPFFGQRKGKTAVLAMLGEIGQRLQLRGCETEKTLSEDGHAATMMRIRARDSQTGRLLTFRLALFARFADDRLASLHAVVDTFDAVEQVLGRHIDLSAVA